MKVTITMPQEDKEMIQSFCEEKGMPLSLFLRRTAKRFIENDV